MSAKDLRAWDAITAEGSQFLSSIQWLERTRASRGLKRLCRLP
jgi:hypothetical protein